MKKINLKLIVLLVLLVHNIGYCQLNYIGLKRNAIIDENPVFRTEMQIINNELYVPTYSGIYKKDMNTFVDTLWQSFAFNGIPVKDFVKKGNEIICITNKSTDSLLLKSFDNGISYVNYTNSHFFNDMPFNFLHKITQNPKNPNSFLVLHEHHGIAKSTDFGASYSNFNTLIGGYQDRFLEFHPQDTLSIYHGGETEIFYSFIQTSFNGGTSWNNLFSIQNDCTHVLAFHPTNDQIILVGHEGRISKSTTKGLSWQTPFMVNNYIYVYKILFNPLNPQIVYATGGINGNNDEIFVLKSDDEGDSWYVAYQEYLLNNGGVVDMLLNDDYLILQTRKEGIYTLNLNSLNKEELKLDNQIKIFPNPTNGLLSIESNKELQKIMIYDSLGRNVENIEVSDSLNQEINLSFLPKGIYMFKIFDKEKNVSYEKIIIK